jgi:hypothetical protein
MANARTVACATFAAAVALGAFGAADALADVTIGQVAVASSPGACSIPGDGFIVATAVSGNPYAVPAGGGEITQWSTSWVSAGSPVTLAVLRTEGLGRQVVGWDSEIVPAGAGHVVTFTPATPIAVEAGDELALYGEADADLPCEFAAAAGNTTDFIEALLGPQAVFTDGGAVTVDNDELPNVSALVVQSADLSVSAPASATAATVGGLVDFSVSAATGGASEAATVTDTLSAGLAPVAASVGSVACTVSGQSFDCPLSGEPATISVIARAVTAGAQTSTATIAGTLSDPDSANNSAQTSVTVAAAPTQTSTPTAAGAAAAATCALAPLKGLPLALAQEIVRDLGCTDGKVTRQRSKPIAKGDVTATSPNGPTTLAGGATVAFTVSSGKPRAHRKHARRGR